MGAGERVMKRGELSGLIVISARVWLNEETDRWSWEIVTNMTNSRSGGYDTALAAARSMVHELRLHSPEF
jgi:hypothetical protein